MTTTDHGAPAITEGEIEAIDAWWRANNFLTIGQIYLQDNALLRRELTSDDIKPRLLGHWGTSPGLSFIYAHVSRLIQHTGQQTIYLTGPGHGGPGLVASAYLDGTYSEVYSDITQDAEGLRRLFRQFSFPGGIPSHVAPETPGSIHEGGELGYVLSHAYGAAFDNPDLLVAAVVDLTIEAGHDGHDHGETGAEEGVDPHFWLDPTRYASAVRAIAEKLAAADPGGATAYAQNADKFVAELTALDEEFAAALKTCETRELVTGHAAVLAAGSLGREAVARIWFDAATTRLRAGMTIPDAAAATVDVARQRAGTAAAEQVRDAWRSIGVDVPGPAAGA